MEQLLEFEQQFAEIERNVQAIEGALGSQDIAPGQARDHLAQLEARLNKLQCDGVDSIDTFELKTGKDQARALRKVLTRRAELMHNHMEGIFQRIKELNLR